MNTRNRAWRRKKNFSKGRRKKHIAMAVCRNWWYEHDGQYIKGNLDKSEHSLDDVRTSIEMALVEIGMEAGNGETEE